MCYVQHIMCFISFDLHNNFMRLLLVFEPFFRCRNQRLETETSSSKSHIWLVAKAGFELRQLILSQSFFTNVLLFCLIFLLTSLRGVMFHAYFLIFRSALPIHSCMYYLEANQTLFSYSFFILKSSFFICICS